MIILTYYTVHNAHYACLTSTTSLPCGIQAGHSRVQLQGSTRSRTALYLSNDCLLVAEVGRRLRSADALTLCVVPRTRTRFDNRSFAVAGPRIWTWTLPAPLHDTNSIYSFKKNSVENVFCLGLVAAVAHIVTSD